MSSAICPLVRGAVRSGIEAEKEAHDRCGRPRHVDHRIDDDMLVIAQRRPGMLQRVRALVAGLGLTPEHHGDAISGR